MTTAKKQKSSQFFQWAADPLLLKAYRALLSAQGYRHFTRGLILAGVQGLIEAVALFAVIPAITSWTTNSPSLGLGWTGWVGLLAALAVIDAALSYKQSMISYTAALDVLHHMNIRIGDRIASLPLGWFRPDTASRLSRMFSQSMMQIGEGAAHFAGPILRATITTVVLTVLAWTWSWYLGLAFVLALPIMFSFTLAARYLRKRGEERTSVTEAALSERLVEFARTQPSLRASGRASNYQPLNDALENNYKARRTGLWMDLAGNVIGGLAVQLITVVLVLLAAYLGSSQQLEPLATIAFIGVSLRFTKVLDTALSNLVGIEYARGPLRSIVEVLTAKPLPEATQPAQLTRPGEVCLRDVTFGYHENTPVIQGATLTATPGTLTAIVGPSGSGKTTLFRLIARFWDAQAGSVSVGGVDVREQPTQQLMEQLAMVFQDVYLYDTTLVENIRVGRDDASDAEVHAAGRLAGVEEIAQRLPKGWNTSVGEGGRKLSGGERQRVSAARALLKQAPIVLFDEATSALDPENEAHIEASIEALRKDATVLVIAHKLHTIRQADQIVVLDEHGRIAQVGTHDQLCQADGLYRQLWQARTQAQGWSLVPSDE